MEACIKVPRPLYQRQKGLKYRVFILVFLKADRLVFRNKLNQMKSISVYKCMSKIFNDIYMYMYACVYIY